MRLLILFLVLIGFVNLFSMEKSEKGEFSPLNSRRLKSDTIYDFRIDADDPLPDIRIKRGLQYYTQARNLVDSDSDKGISENEYLKELKDRFKEAQKEKDIVQLLFLKNEVDLYNQLKQKNNLQNDLKKLFNKSSSNSQRNNLIINAGVLMATIITIVLTQIISSLPA